MLADKYPSFNQFRYWYAKNKNYMSYYISREGKTGFMRNHRVLVGDNVQAFASAPGVGMADSTVIDLYVVSDDRGQGCRQAGFNGAAGRLFIPVPWVQPWLGRRMNGKRTHREWKHSGI